MNLQLFWDGQTSVKVYVVTGTQGARVYTEITLPTSGITLQGRRPCFCEFTQDYVIMAGMYEEPVVFYKSGSSYYSAVAGIPVPTVAPTIALGAAGSVTGNVTEAYISYAHQNDDGLILAESDLKAVSTSLPLVSTSDKLTWGNLEATSPGRVNRIRFWRGMEGGLPRLVGSQVFGSTTYTDDMPTATLALQKAAPNDGSDVLFERETPPDCRYNFLYHQRMFYAGNTINPYRLYYSKINEPEAVGPDDYFDTLSRETITGIGEQGDALVVFCRRAKYALQGWSSGRDGVPADMSFRKVHPSIGTVNHHSILNINGRLWYWAEDGPRVWDGATHWLGAKTDAVDKFKSYPQDFYHGIAVNDSLERCYIFMPYGSNALRPYVVYYEPVDPSVGGGGMEPFWGHDKRTRVDTCRAAWREQDGTLSYITGSSDGYVRLENQYTDNDDDDDAYAKKWQIVGKHLLMSLPGGGGEQEGKTFSRIFSYLTCQDGTWGVDVYAGDPNAYLDAAQPSRSDTFTDATATTTRVIGTTTYNIQNAAREVWEYKPDVSGRGVTLGYKGTSPPQDMKWYGYTIIWSKGSASRVAKSIVAV